VQGGLQESGGLGVEFIEEGEVVVYDGEMECFLVGFDFFGEEVVASVVAERPQVADVGVGILEAEEVLA